MRPSRHRRAEEGAENGEEHRDQRQGGEPAVRFPFGCCFFAAAGMGPGGGAVRDTGPHVRNVP